MGSLLRQSMDPAQAAWTVLKQAFNSPNAECPDDDPYCNSESPCPQCAWDKQMSDEPDKYYPGHEQDMKGENVVCPNPRCRSTKAQRISEGEINDPWSMANLEQYGITEGAFFTPHDVHRIICPDCGHDEPDREGNHEHMRNRERCPQCNPGGERRTIRI